MPHWLDFILGGIIGLTVGIVGSLLTGIGCLFGSESGCTNFPGYFEGVTFFGPPLTGIALLACVILRPRASLRALQRFVAWLHYFFVPHPAEAMIKEATRQGEPQPIDTSQFAEKMKRKMSLNPDDAPAGFKSENQTKKAEKLAARIEAERKLMEAVKEREQALRNAKRGKRTQ